MPVMRVGHLNTADNVTYVLRRSSPIVLYACPISTGSLLSHGGGWGWRVEASCSDNFIIKYIFKSFGVNVQMKHVTFVTFDTDFKQNNIFLVFLIQLYIHLHSS